MPKDEQINKKEAQNFIKRLRKHLGVDHKIRYYITGEYGDTTGRPHYHAIIFNLGLGDHNTRRSSNGFHILGGPIYKSWKTKTGEEKGFAYGGTVTPDSTRYVASYIQKKLYGSLAEPNWQQPFSLMSNGIGKQWLDNNQDQLWSSMRLTWHGTNYPVPKYYRRKIDEQIPFKKDKFSTALKAHNSIYHQEQRSYYDTKYFLGAADAERQHRVQTNKNLESRLLLSRKKI